jgi:hypothetical protein
MNKTVLTSTLTIFFGIFAIPVYQIEHISGQTQEQVIIHYVIQNTTNSMQDPLPGHESHQVVVADPPRDDGRIYSGLDSFTAKSTRRGSFTARVQASTKFNFYRRTIECII